MNFFDNIILKRDILGNNSLIENRMSFHIAFGIDANFTMGTGVLISSILKYNTDNFVFHIFTDSIHNDDIFRFKQLCNNYKDICIIIYHVNANNFKNLPTEYIWTQAIYYRIIACEYLHTLTNTLLYLDSDMLCLNNFGDLFKQNFNSKIIMVVGSIETKDRYIPSLNYNFKNKFYFNSGFIYINLEKWHQKNISSKFFNLLTNHNDFKYFDQDVLNILLNDELIPLENFYHQICPLMNSNTQIDLNTKFIHFAGSTKPWQAWGG